MFKKICVIISRVLAHTKNMGFVQKEVLNLNKKYELALILKPDLSEEAFNAEMDNIKNNRLLGKKEIGLSDKKI